MSYESKRRIRETLRMIPWIVAYILLQVILIVCEIQHKTMLILARYNQRRSLETVTDYLTGILNRRGLFKNFKERIKVKEKFNVIYFSIDNFKIVNDNYGHTYGDNLLKEITTRMTKKIDGKGVIARIGGTDFAVALDGHDFAKHSGVSAYFRKEYIKTGVFDIEFSDIIKESFDLRSDSDYDDFFVVSKFEVEEQISNAQKFYDTVKDYVEKQA